MDDFFFHYSSVIGHDIEKHEEIMKLLKWGKENNKISYVALPGNMHIDDILENDLNIVYHMSELYKKYVIH